ncbi:MAG: hypothetical protein ACYSYL_00205 [Planctomycetota bacterium]|jgi:hypothetical protein
MWRIYYGDGSTFSSNEGTNLEAPAWNVQVVAQTDRWHGRNLQAARDYYIFRDGRWIGCDLAGVLDHLILTGCILEGDEIDTGRLLMHVAREGLVKFGRTLLSERFEAIWRVANADPDFPHRTAYGANEWKPGDDT